MLVSPPPPPYVLPAAGILEESLQQYGSLIPIHVDDVIEKLQEIFGESFSQPHRSMGEKKTNRVHERRNATSVELFFITWPGSSV